MLSFTKPKNLDGAKLIDELVAAGIELTKDYRGIYEPPILDGEGILWLKIDSKYESMAENVISAHNGNLELE